jgi:hypothetical protein
MVGSGGWLTRSDDAAGSCLQGGHIALRDAAGAEQRLGGANDGASAARHVIDAQAVGSEVEVCSTGMPRPRTAQGRLSGSNVDARTDR